MLMWRILVLAVSACGLCGAAVQAETLSERFIHPPADARPMVRWWWFGPSVEKTEIVREIGAMKSGGFGGFELQTVYPLSLSGNVPYLSDAYLEQVRLAGDTANALGLRMDVTLGSGWPFGGPHIPVRLASGAVDLVQIPLPAKAQKAVLPASGEGMKIVAVFVGADITSAQLVRPRGAVLQVRPAPYDRTVFAVIQKPTGQMVKRAAVGAEGPVLNHMNAQAVQTHLHTVGNRLMAALKGHPPFAVFSDSLEVYGADWTDDLLAEFHKRRGYDLKPRILCLFSEGDDCPSVRHDWGQTLSELTDERFLSQANAWAKHHKTKFRAQVYGYPPVTFSSNRQVMLAEGEGAAWRSFTTARWASSANHINGHAVTSAESWTWLHSGAFQATPLDIKAEADQLFLEGINHFVAHGWPYSPSDAAEPGWSFYAAAVFNDHNPWWGVMTDINLYLQRMSFLLRQGEPVSDVAIYLPEDDVLAQLRAGTVPEGPSSGGRTPLHAGVTVSGRMDRMISRTLVSRILDAGYGFDYIDGKSIAAGKLHARVLILPHVSRISASVYSKIAAFAALGGRVIALDKAPDCAAGYRNAHAETTRIEAIRQGLFSGVKPRGTVIAETDLTGFLRQAVAPDVSGLSDAIGFIHRKLNNADLYFVTNTSNRTITASLQFRAGTTGGQWWDARDGSAHDWHGEAITLAPYESRIFIFGEAASVTVPPVHVETPRPRSLADGWSIAFAGDMPRPLPGLISWTAIPNRVIYSGTAVYTRTLHVSVDDMAAGLTTLDFGDGTAISQPPARQQGTRALLTSPVREVAEVFVNGTRAGAIWSPPFRVSLAGLLHPGDNMLEIRVSNTAVNALSAQPLADYQALEARYGERFRAQNMDHLTPQPSGLLQPPTLVTP